METKQMDEMILDGNAIGGLLQHLFARDLTTGDTRCDNCGQEGKVGSLLAFTQAPGVVLRCPVCKEVMARIVMTAKDLYLDLRGASYLRVRQVPTES